MKRILCIVVFLQIGFIGLGQGQFNVGLHGGLPVGDAGDIATASAIGEINYLFEIAEGLTVGPSAGYIYSFGDEINGFEFDDIQFLPLALATRYNFVDSLWLGADIGYAIGIDDGLGGEEGGFYSSPRLGYGISENLDLIAAYRVILLNEVNNFDIVSLGIEFSF